MVGVPRSNACQLCRKRRVKCDEGKPCCRNCVKYGVQCPGYERGIKFVTGKHQIRQKGKQKSGRAASSSSDNTTPATRDVSPLSSSPSSSPGSNLARNRSQAESAPSMKSPRTRRVQVIGTLMHDIEPLVAHPVVIGLFSWVDIEKLGRSALLDGALASLTMHLAGKANADSTMVAHSRTLYGQTLGELQAALNHPKRWRGSETLCAALLLCFFELFAGTARPDSWLQHARGISFLVEQRGPAAHAEGWDAAMLLSFRGILIMSDMFYPRSESCFLSQPKWKAVMRDRRRRLAHAQAHLPEELVELTDDFFDLLADIPAVLRWTFMLKEANRAGIHVEQYRVDALAAIDRDLHERLTLWYQRYKTFDIMPKDAPSQDPDSLYPTILAYDMPWAGSMLIGHWANMLIVQDSLMQCRAEYAFVDSQEELVRNILRSLESLAGGILGAYRVGYAVRIAYEVASAEAQRWIRRLLDRLSKSYAAVDKSMYPNPRLDQGGYS